jgi:hypothetical protein
MAAPNSESGSLKQVLGMGSADGIQIGDAAADLVSFYGAAPVAQQAVGALVTTTGMNTGTSGMYSTTTLNANFITIVAGIQQALKNLGIST